MHSARKRIRSFLLRTPSRPWAVHVPSLDDLLHLSGQGFAQGGPQLPQIVRREHQPGVGRSNRWQRACSDGLDRDFGQDVLYRGIGVCQPLGLPDGTLGVAWPSIKTTFELPLSNLGVLLVASTVGYLISGSQSGHLLSRWGVGGCLFWSTVLTALALGYAVVPSWPLLVVLAAVGGLGTARSMPARMLMPLRASRTPRLPGCTHRTAQGTATGPLLMSWVVERNLPWQLGYLLVAISLAAL